MADEIKIGEGVLDYISELGKIQTAVQNAYISAEKCVQTIEGEDTYEGDAAAEMEAFFKSLAANLQKMVFLYQASATYIYNAYNTLYYNEQQLVNWVIEQIGGE